MSVWPLVVFVSLLAASSCLWEGGGRGGRRLGVGELMARWGSDTRSSSACSPRGWVLPGRTPTLLWVSRKACWPHRFALHGVLQAGALAASRATGVVFGSCPLATMGSQSVFAGESPPQWLRVEEPPVQGCSRWRALGRPCGWLDRGRGRGVRWRGLRCESRAVALGPCNQKLGGFRFCGCCLLAPWLLSLSVPVYLV